MARALPSRAMGIQETWRVDAGRYLRPDEGIEAVIPAEAIFPNPVPIATIVIALRGASRLVVATNQRILIFRRGFFGALGDLLDERPRHVAIGPPHAPFVFFRAEALGERLYIHRRWFKDVRAADAAIAQETTG